MAAPTGTGPIGPFALPVPGYRLGVHTARKRKRGRPAEDEDGTTDIDTDVDAWSTSAAAAAQDPRLPAETINPRSHSPDTLRQFATAGLAPSAEVPPAPFPHRREPSPSRPDGRRRRFRRDDDGVVVQTTAKHRSARLRHLAAVTAIMHRCLAEGDVGRARRALGLLLRTRDVDLRAAHLWAVGSEILVRGGEAGAERQGEGESDNDDDDDDGGTKKPRRPIPHWGTPDGAARARAYLEALAQQHPHDAHRPHLTSALDFWPALFGLEIHGVDAELRRAMRRLDVESDDEDVDRRSYEDDDDNVDREDGEGPYGSGGGGRERERERGGRGRDDDNEADAARDEIRREARDAALAVAARMDRVMEAAPFTKHHELLRLRGMLAVFVADLWVPWRLVARARAHATAGSGSGVGETKSPLAAVDAVLARAAAAGGPEDRAAVAARRAELDAARGFFARIVEGGGPLEGWVRRFVEAEDDDEEGEDYDEDGDREGGGGIHGWYRIHD